MLSARFVPLTSLIVLAAPATAVADDAKVPRVGVVLELVVGLEPSRADAIGKALADALSKKLEVDAFGGGDVSRQLPGEGLPEECLANPDCVADVAARIDADQLIFLALVQVGDELQVDASWIDVGSRSVTSRPRLVLGNDTTAYDLFYENATRYLPDAPIRATRISVGSGPNVVTIPPVPRHMSTPTWIAAGASIGFLGAGAILGFSARSTFQRCETTSCSESEYDGIDSRALYADIAFGAAATAAVVTAVLYLRSGSPGRAEVASVGIAPAPGGAVVGLGGRW